MKYDQSIKPFILKRQSGESFPIKELSPIKTSSSEGKSEVDNTSHTIPFRITSFGWKKAFVSSSILLNRGNPIPIIIHLILNLLQWMMNWWMNSYQRRAFLIEGDLMNILLTSIPWRMNEGELSKLESLIMMERSCEQFWTISAASFKHCSPMVISSNNGMLSTINFVTCVSE